MTRGWRERKEERGEGEGGFRMSLAGLIRQSGFIGNDDLYDLSFLICFLFSGKINQMDGMGMDWYSYERVGYIFYTVNMWI